MRTSKSNTEKPGHKPIVPAVEQAARVLFCLGESLRPKMKLTDICKEIGIHKSKGHYILNTLSQFGLVEKDLVNKTYSLGPSLIFLARNVLDNLVYPEVVAPFLQTLATETSGTAAFGLINEEHVFVVGKHEGNQNIGFTFRLGHRFHLTLGAHGKAIVAFLPEAERERILSKKKLYFHGYDPSQTEMKRLRDELARCRQLGYAQDIGRITPGVNVVSTPVFALHDRIVGCLILIGTFTEKTIEEYGPKTVSIAKQISQKLGARADTLYPV